MPHNNEFSHTPLLVIAQKSAARWEILNFHLKSPLSGSHPSQDPQVFGWTSLFNPGVIKGPSTKEPNP